MELEDTHYLFVDASKFMNMGGPSIPVGILALPTSSDILLKGNNCKQRKPFKENELLLFLRASKEPKTFRHPRDQVPGPRV